MKQNYEGLYDVSYRIINNRPNILLFIRNKDGTKTIKKIDDFRPYGYIDTKELESKRHNIFIREIPKKNYKTIFGDEVRKFFIQTPNKMYKINSYFARDKLYETDILFDLRYVIDKIGDVTQTKYKTTFWDIETTTDYGFTDANNPIESIICISIYDNFSEKNITFVWRKDLVKKSTDIVHFFDNEEEMLNSFISYWNKLDSDIVTAWNLSFDINYLISRCKFLKIDYNILCNIDNKKLDVVNNYYTNENTNKTIKIREETEKRKMEVEILGIVLFDSLQAYRKLHFGELSSYALNDIATLELNEEKEKVYNTGDVWRKNLNKLISYNRKDVDLIVNIDKKCKLISIFDDIKRFSGVRNINDCFFASRIHETKILRQYHNKLVFPNKPPFQEKTEKTKIKGALVREPTPGIYKNIVVLDFKSLYPSIIYTFNLSTEMVHEDGVEINGINILQEPKGIMPSMIKELIQLKEEMKEKVKGTGQDISDKMFAIKIFINSFYGINSLTSFRLYNKQIAEDITFLGRYICKKCSKIVKNDLGYDTIYGDTDSLFIQIPDNKDVVEEGKKIQNLCNELTKKVAEEFKAKDSILFIEFEKIFSSILFVAKKKSETGAKKRYAGIISYEDKNGEMKETNKLKIVGMDSRKCNTPLISKEIQEVLVTKILGGTTKIECITYITNIINDIIDRKIDIEKISLPSKLNKPIEEYPNRPCVRGVNFSNKHLNTKFKSGMKFKLIYVNDNRTDCVCFEEEEQLNNLKIDWQVMIDKCVFQKVSAIFKTLGWENDLLLLNNSINNRLINQKELFNYV